MIDVRRIWLASLVGAAVALAPAVSLPGVGISADRVAAGETVYANYCSNCHGEQLQNTSGGVTFDLRRLRSSDRDRFFAAVLDGKKAMPPWRGVLELHQIESIWAYIRASVDRPGP